MRSAATLAAVLSLAAAAARPHREGRRVGWRSGRYAGRGIRFETNEKGTVTSIYAGRRDPIRYIEGCA